MKQFEFADTVETEEPVHQQDRVLSCCIPLHVRTFSKTFEDVQQGSL